MPRQDSAGGMRLFDAAVLEDSFSTVVSRETISGDQTGKRPETLATAAFSESLRIFWDSRMGSLSLSG